MLRHPMVATTVHACSGNRLVSYDQPESSWEVLKATTPVYYLFPNVQLIPMAGSQAKHIACFRVRRLSGFTWQQIYPTRSFSSIVLQHPDVLMDVRDVRAIGAVL